MSGPLVVTVDGTPMADEEARALWQRFSTWMEEHQGDLAGFAAQEGFASVHPGVEGGRPVLRASRTDPQRPYAAAERRAGGSGNRHAATGGGASPNSKRRKSRGTRRS